MTKIPPIRLSDLDGLYVMEPSKRLNQIVAKEKLNHKIPIFDEKCKR